MANQQQLNEILKSLSQKLNTTPEKLKSAVEQGNLQDITKTMDSSQAEKLNKVLSDPNMTQKLMSTPQAQELMKKLMGN